MKLKNILLLPILTLFIFTPLYADEMDKGEKLFNNGDYTGALEVFFKLTEVKDEDDRAEAFYRIGVSQNKLQKFEAAAYNLKKAIENDYDEDDVYYEYGQAQYGSQDLKGAKESFLKSYDNDFQVISSLYYVAYISQMLEEYEMAEDHYNLVLQHEDLDITMNQSSKFQLAKIELARIEADTSLKHDEMSVKVRADIIPMLREALTVSLKSSMASDINATMKMLIEKYNIMPKKLANGRIVPDKAWKLRLSERMDRDSNVVLEGDEFENQDTDIASLINDTKFLFNYRFIFKDRVTVTPQIRMNRKFHMERDNSAIFQNDNYGINPAVFTTYEHTFKGKQASALFDVTYGYTARDFKRNGDLLFYARTLGIAFGEKIKLMGKEDTTIKIKWSSQSGYTEDIDNTIFGIFASQGFTLKNKHKVLVMTDWAFKSVEKEVDSKNTFLFRGNYIIPNIYKNAILSAGLGLTLTDTKEQRTTRGTEITINPGIALIQRMNSFLDLSISYDFTKNTSDDKVNFAYSKHVFGLELKLEL